MLICVGPDSSLHLVKPRSVQTLTRSFSRVHAGGVFSRQAEVTFQPGNERLSIKQQFKGIDEHDHLVVSTNLEGRLPAVLLGSSVQINPYKEIYQYDTNRKDAKMR